MKRRLFNLLAAASLLLCVATAALWVRSHWVGDLVSYSIATEPQGGEVWYFESIQGESVFAWQEYPGIPYGLRYEHKEPKNFWVRGDSVWNRLGFAYFSRDFSRDFRVLLIPIYLPVTLLSILPIWWLKARWPRAKPGHCTVCGYDLRATPDRCPECGTVPKTISIPK